MRKNEGAILRRSPKAVELSIVMPCLNEANSLRLCLEKAFLFLERNQVSGEVIVADNGSTDGSLEIAEELGARVVRVPARGYGFALMSGFLAARGEYIIMGDSDNSYDFSDVRPLLDKLRSGFELVVGNRFRSGIKPGAMPFLHRYLGNPVLSFLGRLFFSAPCRDFHCGLRGLRRESALRMDLTTGGMEFATEMVAKAAILGMRIGEVPVVLWPDNRGRPPHLRTWRDGWRHLRFLLLFSPRWLFALPGSLLFFLGIFSMLWLGSGPRRVGHVVFDVHTLIYSAFSVLIGFQFLTFTLFSIVFSEQEKLKSSPQKLSVFLRWLTLERGILGGLALTLLGGAMTVEQAYHWYAIGFGDIAIGIVLRRVVVSALLATLGVNIIAASFYIGLIRLRTGRMDSAALARMSPSSDE